MKSRMELWEAFAGDFARLADYTVEVQKQLKESVSDALWFIGQIRRLYKLHCISLDAAAYSPSGFCRSATPVVDSARMLSIPFW